jgi:hypothetical protein
MLKGRTLSLHLLSEKERKGKERKTNEPAKKVQAIIPKYANQQTRKQKKIQEK